MAGWVKNAGGTFQNQFDDETTTHLIVDEKVWKNKTSVVQAALAVNESEDSRKVFIVSPEWIEDCLSEWKKSRESTYLWEKLDPAAPTQSDRQKKKNGKKPGDEDDDLVAGPRGHVAMMGEVFQESTESYINDRDRRLLEDQIAGEKKAQKEAEDAEAARKAAKEAAVKQQSKERAAEMKKSVKRGRGEVFMQNNRVYQDATGFEYDITLTKVDPLVNSNERFSITIQIYESNSEPRTYTTNVNWAGTLKRPKNNIIAAIGSNLPTAIRVFRKAFREQTGHSWDDRIKVHNERVKARQQLRDESPGPLGTRPIEDEDKVPFKDRKFEYMPPAYGPKGLLPDGKDKVPEFIKRRSYNHRGRRNGQVEQWMMSGANGNGPSNEDPAGQAHMPIDLTEDEPAELPKHQETTSAAVIEPEVGKATDNTTDKVRSPTFVAGVGEWLDQTEAFDAGNLSEQQNFNFDQNDFDLGNASGQEQQFDFDQYAAANDDTQGAQTGVPLLDDAQSFLKAHGGAATQVGQTQLAANVGEDLFDFLDTKGVQGTEAGQGEHGTLESAGDQWPESMLNEFDGSESALGKRKREQGDSEGLVAKRVQGESVDN
ncbi:hypothetical protein Q7P37_003702 [Cladosporium fusiforme]